MARLEIHEEIAAPVNEVAVFFVPQRMPYWYGVEIQAQFEISDGCADFRAGQKVRIRGHVGRREVSHTSVVTRYEFGRLLEWRFQDSAGVCGLQSWELRPGSIAAGDDAPASEDSMVGTRVIMRNDYEMPGRVGRLLDYVFTRHAVARRDRDALARLSRLSTRG
jgi:hypothetical protein